MCRAILVVMFQFAALVAIADVPHAITGVVAVILAGGFIAVVLCTVLKWEGPLKVVSPDSGPIRSGRWPKAA